MRTTRSEPLAVTCAALAIGILCLLRSAGSSAAEVADGIRLNVSPRVCTLTSRDTECRTQVHAEWRSPRSESLCLLILGRPEIRRCWESEQSGAYSIDLVFAADLTVELREPDLQHILASETLRVIREAVNYRHRRRQPWSIFD